MTRVTPFALAALAAVTALAACSTPPQTGELNYPVIFDAIDAMGWKGWVGAEYGPGGPTVDSLSWGKPYGIG